MSAPHHRINCHIPGIAVKYLFVPSISLWPKACACDGGNRPFHRDLNGKEKEREHTISIQIQLSDNTHDTTREWRCVLCSVVSRALVVLRRSQGSSVVSPVIRSRFNCRLILSICSTTVPTLSYYSSTKNVCPNCNSWSHRQDGMSDLWLHVSTQQR